MEADILIGLALFAFVSSITPGPNNAMLMASGANFGLARSLSHMFGVGLGFMLMVLVVGVGVVQLLDRFPLIDNTLTVICVVYLLYLAYRIARAANVQSGVTAESKPLSFIQAAMFQWVNPKTWTMAVTANSLYAPDYEFSAVVLVASVFGLVNFPCIAIWTILGTGLRRLLTNPTRLTTFNYVMAGLLILSVLPLLTWPGSTQS